MSRAQPSPPGAGGLEGRRLALATLLAWRERLRARRAARAARQAAAERLYRDLVGVARAPRFFREIGVPDTPEGRFEMIGLHAALILPGLHDAPRAHFADAFDIEDTQRLFGQNSQSLQTEGFDQPLRIRWADAFDQA